MTTLTYDPLPSGYVFNLIEKIFLKTGYRPGHSRTGLHSYLNFDEDLTAQEETDVDTIIGDGSTCQEPIIFVIQNNTIIIKDVYEYRSEIETEIGFNIAVTYRSSGTKGAVYDEIVVQATDPTYQAQKIMTNPERNSLIGALEDLIRLE